MYELFGRKPKYDDEYDYDGLGHGNPDPLTWPQRALLVLFVVFIVISFMWSAQPAKAGVLWFNDTATPLTGAATFTGTTRDLGPGATNWTFFGCQFNADQTGTGSIENSTDAVTWLQAATVAIVANVGVDLNVRARARYYRCKLVNGATPQTVNRVVSSWNDY
jgi:hypothetical protein